MNPLKLFATTLLLLIASSASAWDAPWDRDGHDRWGHRGDNDLFGDFWDDGFGDIFGDAFGDVDFEIRFRASGDGWGRGWGDNFWNSRNRYYNGYRGYNNYRSGYYRRGPYGGYGTPRYGVPYGQRPYAYSRPPQRHTAAPAQRRAVPPAHAKTGPKPHPKTDSMNSQLEK